MFGLKTMAYMVISSEPYAFCRATLVGNVLISFSWLYFKKTGIKK